MASLPAGLFLRPEESGDRDFLLDLYRSTREEEMAASGWSESWKQEFVRLQFEARNRHYRSHFLAARDYVVLLEREPIGRLSVEPRSDEIRLLDLALLPSQRGRGIGTLLLQQLFTEADAAGLPVRLHVDKGSRAERLYARLGFRLLAEKDFHLLLERPPPALQPRIAS